MGSNVADDLAAQKSDAQTGRVLEAATMLLTLSLAIWAGWLIAKLGPDTWMGRACQERLIDRPAAWVVSITPRRAVSLILSGTVVTLAVAYLAPIISGDAALVLAGDALAYVEVLTAVMLVAIRSGRPATVIRRSVGIAAVRVLATCRGVRLPRAARLLRKPSRLFPPADDPDPAFATA